MDDVMRWAALIVAVTAASGAVYKYFLHPVIRFTRRASAFLEDWGGHAADPHRGIQERHGVMRRLTDIEREVKYNGGSVTLADAVKDLQTGQAALEQGRQANAAGIACIGDKMDKNAATAAEVRRDLQEYRAESTDRIADLAEALEKHSADGAEFLGQALSELANKGIKITPPTNREQGP